jgi:hypothetical protein
MFTLAKTILSTVAVLCLLGEAGPARASDHNGQDHTYGGPVQTWCDINPGCKGVHRTSFEGGASAAAASPTAKPHPAHKSRHEASNR